MSERVCKICGAKLTPQENKICDYCYEILKECREEREPTQTEEIFGSEDAYYRYRNG